MKLISPQRNSHMKDTGTLVVSLRGINYRVWSYLGCLGRKAKYLPIQVSLGINLLEISV